MHKINKSIPWLTMGAIDAITVNASHQFPRETGTILKYQSAAFSTAPVLKLMRMPDVHTKGVINLSILYIEMQE